VPKLSIDLEFFSRAHEKFEEQNKDLEYSIIIINYFVIIINKYCNCRRFTITLRNNTFGRTPLGEGSAHSSIRTTHYTHNRQTSMPLAVLGLAIPTRERQQTDALDSVATGFGRLCTEDHYFIWQLPFVTFLPARLPH